MWKQIGVKLLLFVLGVVVGGGVVYGIIKFTENSSSSGNGTSNSTGTRANYSLKYVIAISRHGNKGAWSDYPLDPYPWNNTEYWPYGGGQLTPHGRVQEYNLGLKLRSLYNGFLNTTFYTDDIYACTDLYDRTMMSGELVLAGLYPPEGWQVWNKTVNWQPIPLYTNSSDHTQSIQSCLKALEEEVISYTAFLEEDAANITELIDMVYNLTGVQLTSSFDLTDMYEKLVSEETEGYDLPGWTKSLYPDPLTDYFGKRTVALAAGSDEITRLYVGNLLEDIIEALGNKSEGMLAERKMSYYSGHDYTLLNLQIALGVPKSSIVKIVMTGSALLIELHQDLSNSEYWLKVLYIDGSSLDSGPVSLILPDCGEPCYLNSFINATQRFTNVSFEEECQLTN